MTIAAIVLAGHRPSLLPDRASALFLASFRGRPLVSWAVDAARAAELDETIVVTGSADLSAVLPSHVTEVHNNRWPEGAATSLHAGLAAASWEGHSVAVVGCGDQPLIGAGAWIGVASTEAPIAVASFDGRRSWPVRLSAEIWSLLAHVGDDPVALFMQTHPKLVVDVPCTGDPHLFASVEELAAWG